MFGLLTGYRVHLCPEVMGKITHEGKSIPNLEIRRTLIYEKERVDKAITGADGSFYFPEKIIRSRVPARMFEVHNVQIIATDYEKKKYILWYAGTSSIVPERAVVEKLASMNCELTTPESLQHFENHERPAFTHNVHSICRWESGDYEFPAVVDES